MNKNVSPERKLAVFGKSFFPFRSKNGRSNAAPRIRVFKPYKMTQCILTTFVTLTFLNFKKNCPGSDIINWSKIVCEQFFGLRTVKISEEMENIKGSILRLDQMTD